jgi:hypothetical protein
MPYLKQKKLTGDRKGPQLSAHQIDLEIENTFWHFAMWVQLRVSAYPVTGINTRSHSRGDNSNFHIQSSGAEVEEDTIRVSPDELSSAVEWAVKRAAKRTTIRYKFGEVKMALAPHSETMEGKMPKGMKNNKHTHNFSPAAKATQTPRSRDWAKYREKRSEMKKLYRVKLSTLSDKNKERPPDIRNSAGSWAATRESDTISAETFQRREQVLDSETDARRVPALAAKSPGSRKSQPGSFAAAFAAQERAPALKFSNDKDASPNTPDDNAPTTSLNQSMGTLQQKRSQKNRTPEAPVDVQPNISSGAKEGDVLDKKLSEKAKRAQSSLNFIARRRRARDEARERNARKDASISQG